MNSKGVFDLHLEHFCSISIRWIPLPKKNTQEPRDLSLDNNSLSKKNISESISDSDSPSQDQPPITPLTELESAQQLADQYFSQLQYLQADFDNYRKQVSKDRAASQKRSNRLLILDLLKIVDDLDRAIMSLPDQEHRHGLQMVYDCLLTLLKHRGLEPISAIGEPFNPYYHEALLKVPSDQPEDTVLEELRKGYLLNKEVLRYSQVKVAGGKPHE